MAPVGVAGPGLRPVKETELHALKERLARHLPYSLPVSSTDTTPSSEHTVIHNLPCLKQQQTNSVSTLKEYGSVSLAVRFGLHSLQPASILVPAAPRPTSLTIIAPVCVSTSFQYAS